MTSIRLLTCQQAAEELELTDGRIRQICTASHADPSRPNIGQKHGKMWMLTDADVEKIKTLPDLRRTPVA